MHFELLDAEPYPSKKDDNGNNEKFQLQRMTGGTMKKEFMLFINRTDKRKGLVINSVDDIPSLIKLLERSHQNMN